MAISAKKQYQDLVNRIVAAHRPDVKVSKMYGIPVMMTRGRAFAGFLDDDLVVRLDPAALAKAQQLKGSKPFTPDNGKDMTEWICVPVVQISHWRGLLQDALYYINKT